MAFRGRGRGRGYGGFRAAKQEPFELFPEIKDLPDAKSVKEERVLFTWGYKLQKFWKSSPYYYEGVGEAAAKKIESFSNKDSERSKPKPPLSHFILMTDGYVPAELCKKERHGPKRVRWNPESELQDIFEKFEQKRLSQDDKGEEAKKDDKDEEEDDERIEEEDEEFSDDGDYNQNVDFDDDDDDFNMEDDNDGDGPTY